MKALAPLLALTLPLCAIAETTPPAQTSSATKVDTLTDQLIASLRQDLEDLRGKNETRADHLQSLAASVDTLVRSGPGAPSMDDPNSITWNSRVIALGSKRSNEIAEALIGEIQVRNAETAPLARAKAEAIAKEVAAGIFKAKTAAELDPLLRKLDTIPLGVRGARTEGNRTAADIGRLKNFLKRWQTMLAQQEAGQPREALQTLRNFTADNDVPAWIDQAEVLRRVQVIAKTLGQPSPEEIAGQIRALAEKALVTDTVDGLDSLLADSGKLRLTIAPWRDPQQLGNRLPELNSLIEARQDALVGIRDKNPLIIQPAIDKLGANVDRYLILGLSRSAILDHNTRLRERGIAAARPAAREPERAGGERTIGQLPKTAASATAILDKIHTLADIQPALPTLMEIKQSLVSPEESRWSSIIWRLAYLSETSARLKDGLSCRMIMATLPYPANIDHPNILILQKEFDLLALESGFADETGLHPQPDELPETYAGRMRDKLIAEGKLEALQRLHLACHYQAPTTPVFTKDDSDAIALYLFAKRMDVPGGDPRMVVAHYHLALRINSKLIPIEEVTKRLAEIEKSHPEDYKAGFIMVTPGDNALFKGRMHIPGPTEWIIAARPAKSAPGDDR